MSTTISRSGIIGMTFIIVLLTIVTTASTGGFPDPPIEMLKATPAKATAVFAGGCFWGVEAVFERLKGVSNVTSGYSGGSKETAHYDVVGTGLTGHAESVLIEYDSSKITFGTLLKVFFAVAHDPTQLNYQGPDYGTQYRSAIFYGNDEQRRIAEEYVKVLTTAKTFPKKIVTEITRLDAFYPAEEYHQNFMERNPTYPYIVYWDKPKIEHLLAAFPELVTKP